MELSKYDYDVLEYLSNFEYVTLENLLNKFPDNKYGTLYRLQLLSKPETFKDQTKISKLDSFLNEALIIENGTYEQHFFISSNTFSLSSKGRKILLDYKLSKKKSILKYLDDLIFKILPLLISLLAIYKSKP